uniref:Uncharacterized protein n=1 Tax=Rhizophora mucronata TaxID=61149 RepID=A0A2P2ISV0_RHIMU
MGRSPCCEKEHTNKGAWTKEEDERLINHIKSHGEGSWRSLPRAAGIILYILFLSILPLYNCPFLFKEVMDMLCFWVCLIHLVLCLRRSASMW